MNRIRHWYVCVRLAIAVALASLTGCATVPHAAHILIPCHTQAVAKPDFPADHVASSDIWDQAKALLADRQVRKGYEAQLETQVEACK